MNQAEIVDYYERTHGADGFSDQGIDFDHIGFVPTEPAVAPTSGNNASSARNGDSQRNSRSRWCKSDYKLKQYDYGCEFEFKSTG